MIRKPHAEHDDAGNRCQTGGEQEYDNDAAWFDQFVLRIQQDNGVDERDVNEVFPEQGDPTDREQSGENRSGDAQIKCP